MSALAPSQAFLRAPCDQCDAVIEVQELQDNDGLCDHCAERQARGMAGSFYGEGA